MSKLAKSILINGLIFLSVYFAVHLYQTRLAPSGQAPEINGWLIEGNEFSKLRNHEKPLLVHFWATWCKVCEFGESSINRLAKDYQLITVASQSGSFSEIKKFKQAQGLEFPIIVDQNGVIAKEWGIVGFPTSFVVDKNNEIRFVEVGFTTEWGLRFRLWLSELF